MVGRDSRSVVSRGIHLLSGTVHRWRPDTLAGEPDAGHRIHAGLRFVCHRRVGRGHTHEREPVPGVGGRGHPVPGSHRSVRQYSNDDCAAGCPQRAGVRCRAGRDLPSHRTAVRSRRRGSPDSIRGSRSGAHRESVMGDRQSRRPRQLGASPDPCHRDFAAGGGHRGSGSSGSVRTHLPAGPGPEGGDASGLF